MRTPDFDPYAVLGVNRNATSDEIKAAYRELVAKYHPDRHHGNPLEDLAAAKLAEINQAYEILSDPGRKAAYDRGQPPWPRPVGSPFGAPDIGRRKRRTWPYVIGLLLLLPLVVRLAIFLTRTFARLFRLGVEGLGAARGTPLALAAVALVVVVAAWLFVRWRRRNR
jgi:curved DNA-binding protein CbpA